MAKRVTRTKKPSKKPKEPEVLFLVGRYFVCCEGGEVKFQGLVRGQVDDENYLVQFLDEATMAIVPVRHMVTSDMSDLQHQLGWQFFEDEDQLEAWLAARQQTTGDAADDEERLART